jgi:hypothetical protein
MGVQWTARRSSTGSIMAYHGGREVLPRCRPPSSSARVAPAGVDVENDRRRRHGR